MKFKIINRKDATDKGLHFFFTGKVCKWGHVAPRYTNKGALHARINLDKTYAKTGLCCNCVDEMCKSGGMLGESFEDIMLGWDNSHEGLNIVKLPILSGTSKMGYKVVGESLIDSIWWDDCSNWLWVIDNNGYIKASLSKGNMKRNGLTCNTSNIKYIHLHRFIKGVSAEVPYVVDHINGCRGDNRNENLRMANTIENSYNSRKSVEGTSKYKGVTLKKSAVGRVSKTGLPVKTWVGHVYRDSCYKSKLFHNEIDAALWYDNIIRKEYPSDFNVYNFPKEGERSAIQDQ